jgi:hypothetical protein
MHIINSHNNLVYVQLIGFLSFNFSHKKIPKGKIWILTNV